MSFPPSIKCVVIGNGAVGKTCMLISYTKNQFPEDYVPTVFDIHAMDVKVNGQPYILNLFDTAGQEEYDKLRPLGYQKTNVFLICFSVVNQASFESVKSKWVLEAKHFCPRARYILVGTQIDLRTDEKTLDNVSKRKCRLISRRMGESLGKSIGADKYLECSALTQEGLREIFEEVVKMGVRRPPTGKSICNLF